MALTEEVVSPDGTRLGVELVGTGPRVLFVHGGTADRTRWSALAEHLDEKMTLCLLDRRGRGLSRAEASSPYTWRREAADIAAVAEALETRAVIAHSYGGLCALGALQVTTGIEAALLYEPTVPVPGNPIMPIDVLESIGELLHGGHGDQALATFFTRVVGATEEEVARRRASPDWGVRLRALPTALREGAAIAGIDIDDLGLENVYIPTTVLVGENSPGPLAAAARAVASRLPRCDLVQLRGRGHAAMDQDPQAFAQTVLAALGADRV